MSWIFFWLNDLIQRINYKLKLCTACGHRMAYRKWKETKLQPVTAGPGIMLGCSLVSIHFRWAILCPQAVGVDLRQQTVDLLTMSPANGINLLLSRSRRSNSAHSDMSLSLSETGLFLRISLSVSRSSPFSSTV